MGNKKNKKAPRLAGQRGKKGGLFLVAVDESEGAVRVEFQVKVVVTFAVAAVLAVEIDVGGAIRVDTNIFDAVRVNAVVGAIAPFEHSFQLTFNVPMFGSIIQIPVISRHNVRLLSRKNWFL